MSNTDFLNAVKTRIGMSEDITDFDTDINLMISDALHDMSASGIGSDALVITGEVDGSILNCVALYCMAYMGEDRSNTDKYLEMYRGRVSRLALEYDEDGETDEDEEGDS